ncbi:MAG: hypothetical protein ACREP1_05040, partial [Rhodanobacteraceae bacterium]
VNVGADATGTLTAPRERTARIVERLWAVIVIEVVQWLVFFAAMREVEATGGSNWLGPFLAGTLLFMLSAAIVYADIFACLAPEVPALTIVRDGFYRSFALAWQNFSRALCLLFVQVAIGSVLQLGALGLQSLHVRGSDLWMDDVAGTLIGVPFSAFITLVYLDNLKREREAEAS